jgi:hypothetical protein
MANQDPPVRVAKRRRTGRKPPPMVEDDDSALDTAMYQNVEVSGTTRQKVLVPVRLDQPVQSQANAEPGPVPAADRDPLPSPGIDIDWNEHESTKSLPKQRSSYMKEFVARVDCILGALLARDAMPHETCCSGCGKSVGRWRCRDCTSAKLLCRACMRATHFPNPFHRIECWTGIYFRKAALWEVGVYLNLNHHQAPTVCHNLKWQMDILETFQKVKDERDHLENDPTPLTRPDENTSDYSGPAPDTEQEGAEDESVMKMLDKMLQEHNPECVEEDDDELGHDPEADIEDNDAGAAGFVNYIPPYATVPDPADSGTADHMQQAPQQDALNNRYVRVVHTNGIHHIALVCCTCRGHDNIASDLFYARLVPASFARIRTIFTTAVLDHFRLCNLEMRSSAYQFYQMLRRVTMPMNPASVVNLYHELRRLSRLWRWVKKLKWAGYGQRPGDPIMPQPGELAEVCPACPQAGINIPDDWRDDPNRWVFKRVFVADGNFKANHVRQKSPAEDIWLSDGLGMTTRQSEYKEFLKTAQEWSTVSLAV